MGPSLGNWSCPMWTDTLAEVREELSTAQISGVLQPRRYDRGDDFLHLVADYFRSSSFHLSVSCNLDIAVRLDDVANLDRCPFPIKSPALSACVSPQAIHF